MLNKHPEIQMPPIKELRYFLIKERIGKVNLLISEIVKTMHFSTYRFQLLQMYLCKDKRITNKWS